MARSGADPEKLGQHAEAWHSTGIDFRDLQNRFGTFLENVAATVDRSDPVAAAFWERWHSGFRGLMGVLESSNKVLDGTGAGLRLMDKGFTGIQNTTEDAARRLAGGMGDGLPGGPARRS
ncbi:hypothetical protein [Streptomyces sp. NPDC004658]|uniref:hypothetical protein n=1 Tax=Streptomyces sp. NPDC004658 TaxID=3154672 RepID=UPI0033A5F896